MMDDAATPGVGEGGRDPAGDEAVDRIVETRDRLRTRARTALGVEGPEVIGDAPPLRATLQRSDVGLYPLLALGVLAIVDDFQGFALGILGPEVAKALGIGKGTLAAVVGLKLLAVALATLPMAAYVQNRPHRALVSIVTAFAWGTVTLFTGFVGYLPGLVIVLLLDGASTGSVHAVHQPLLMDSYPPAARVRAFSYYSSLDSFGKVLAPLLIAGLTALFAFTWRGVFLVMGLVSLTAAVFALRLRDPGFGRWDTSRLRELVRTGEVRSERSELEERTRLGFFEIVRRLMMIRTQRRIYAAFALLGVFFVPFQTFFFFYLDERWNLDAGGRGLFTAVMSTGAMIALLLFAKTGESLFRRDPATLMRLAAWLFGLTFVAVSVGTLMPRFLLMSFFFAVAFALFAVQLPTLYVAALSTVPPNMRPHAAALARIYLAGVGGIGGAVLLGSVDERFGIVVALVASGLPAVLGAFVIGAAARSVNDDLDRLIDDVIEEEEVRQLADAGVRLPLLACKGIDFSYGQLQVLFDVDFTVDEGEMVALLGVNGAGKSTLLRVISGLGLPSRGSVRLHGVDITYVDVERRARLGIALIPGGQATFGPLSVLDNLRMNAYSLDRDREAVRRGIERSFEAFPRLAERRHQPAATLSGGEQQMLALSKALIVRPRLLLIDELSLGLAPVIVEQLLDLVRQINAAGTAVVLVEQSVNLALSLVDHAYFMEKGQIRFDGPADDLLGREDLLRAVFLEGVSQETGV